MEDKISFFDELVYYRHCNARKSIRKWMKIYYELKGYKVIELE